MATQQIDRSGGSPTSIVLDRANGLSSAAAMKAPVYCATTASITLSGEQTIDGVTTDESRVLVKDQSTASQNGIYISSTGVWQRAPDFNRTDDVREGTRVWVTDGTTNGQSEWVVTTANDIVIGTTSITFTAVSSLGAGAALKANNLSDLANKLTAHDNLTSNGSTIVSANPLPLDSADGDWIDVSGNTGFSAVTLTAGNTRIVRFTGAPLATVGASLVGNNGGANVQFAAGDWGIFRGYASSIVRFWRIPVATLFADVEDQTLTGGARVTSKDLGTASSGTVTLDPGDRSLQHYINGGAHTLAPGANTGSILLDITNNGSAGAITVSGWTKVVGAFTTTNGHKFRCSCSVGSGGSLLTIQALQ